MPKVAGELPFDESKVAIIEPKPGELVTSGVTVKGFTPALPDGWTRWLAVYALTPKVFYPTEIDDKKESWEQDVTVGSANCDGAIFTIYLLIAPPDATAYLRSVSECTAKLPECFQLKIKIQRKPRATFQSITGNKIKGPLIQISTGGGADQKIENNTAEWIYQSQGTKEEPPTPEKEPPTPERETLKLPGGFIAKGPRAGILLVIALALILAYQIIVRM